MELISYRDAKENGLVHYFTGKPCKRGHINKRYISTRQCFQCSSSQRESWRDNNRERTNELTQNWKARNRLYISNYNKIYSSNNRGYFNMKQRLRQKNISEQFNRLPESEKQDIIKLYDLAYIYSQVEEWDFHIDHIYPLSEGGKHTISNLQILEAALNLKKKNTIDSEGTYIGCNPFTSS